MTAPNLEPVVSKALLDLPSPIAAEPFEPGFWRSCVTWEEIVEKATPAVVAAIRDSGYTVIALPEAHNTWAGRSEWLRSADPDNRVGWCTWTSPGHRVMLQRAEPELTPDEAADLGAALIAAAKHAKGDTQ